MKTMHDYTTVLTTLQQIAPEAHIAGGAVRDTILQKQIHDIDVFMSDKHVEEAAALLRSSCSYVKVGEWKEYLGFSDPAIPQANMARFDFGICMAAFDGKQTIRADAFDCDVENHSFTLRRADNQAQFNYSMSRYDKITAGRYSGWSLVLPDEYEFYFKEYNFRKHWYRDEEGNLVSKGLGGPSLLKPKERIAAHQ